MYYPHSMLKFVLLSFVLMCLPLFWALFKQNAALEELAAQSSASIMQASDIARLAQECATLAENLGRQARSYMVVEDPRLLKRYEEERARLLATDAKLTAELSKEDAKQLIPVREKEIFLWQSLQKYKTLTATQKRTQRTKLEEDFAAYVNNARAVQASADSSVLGAVERLHETASASQKKWQNLLYASLVIAVIMSLALSFIIARPVLALDSAIRQLGNADFSRPIEVQGTKDFRYLGERLEWLRARLQILEDQKNVFLRNVSHELKTPLTSIREGSELLRDGVLGDLTLDQQDIVEIVHKNTLALQKMIENILDFHQAQSQDSPLGKVMAQDLSALVEKVAESHRLVALRLGVTFDLSVMPVWLTFDEKKMTSIVDNLISNAIKFSPNAGKITVTLNREPENVRLDVEDDGPGVPKEDRQKIFESFYQGAQPENDAPIKGSGLGLAIAQTYARQHGGLIEVGERTSGQRGARFTLWLPKIATKHKTQPKQWS